MRRKTTAIYYYLSPDGYEVDFYVPEKGLLIQVTQHLANLKTREREIRVLGAAIEHLNARHAMILSDANEDSLEINGVPVEIRSIAEWLIAD